MSDINKNFLDEFGGRNLLLNSNEKYETSRYNIADYPLAEAIPEGTEVTISIKGQLAEGKTSFGIFNSGGSLRIATLRPNQQNNKGVYSVTFNWIVESNTNTFVRIYQLPNSATDEISTIEWVKLEYGNIATDWTPAPEEINSKKYVKNTRYGINKILAYYYPSVKGSEKDTYLFLNHLNNSIYTTNYKIALCLTLIENEKFNMTRFQELKSKINHLSKYIYSLETLIRYTLENKIYIKD